MLNEFLESHILKNLELLSFKLNKSKFGKKQGIHSSIKKGSGLEFSDFRAYTLGDNPKNIDWHIFAKTEKLYIKEFKEYQNINFFIYLDSSASMATPKDSTKWEQALKISSALSYIALINNESLTIATSGGFLSSKFSTAKNFSLVLKNIEDIKPSQESFFSQKLSLPLSKIKFPGIAICISDFLTPFDDIKEGIDKLRAKNLEISLINITSPKFLDLIPQTCETFVDSETNEERIFNLDSDAKLQYIKNYKNHLGKIRRYAYKYDINFYELKEDDDILKFLNESNLCS